MRFDRYYTMNGKPGEIETLRRVLLAFRDAVMACPGSLGVDLLQGRDLHERFVFIEHWESAKKHGEAGRLLPAALFAEVKAALSEPPQFIDLAPVEDH